MKNTSVSHLFLITQQIVTAVAGVINSFVLSLISLWRYYDVNLPIRALMIESSDGNLISNNDGSLKWISHNQSTDTIINAMNLISDHPYTSHSMAYDNNLWIVWS